MQIRDEKRWPRMMRQTGRRKLKFKSRSEQVIQKKEEKSFAGYLIPNTLIYITLYGICWGKT